ncbi:MAG: hypothetical protein V7L14_24800 [Nostoc sp.]|uniref:hypothetical protein n=1 Tax=Nostoc sp. TaxID=1180 RepID=UPI002FFA966A
MIAGSFGDNGELLFEIELVAANDEKFSVEALFDTGFTDGWLAINTQDLEVGRGTAMLISVNLS